MKPQLLDRLILPILMPLGILALIAAILYTMSRILLASSKEVAPAVALTVALSILLTSAYLATTPVSRRQLMTMIALPVIVLAVGGVWGQIRYSNKGEEHGGEAVSGGPVSMTMADNSFRQSSLTVKVGSEVTFEIRNGGAAIHNMRLAGPDNIYDTSDDAISTPDTIRAGASAILKFTFDKAGAMNFRCDFHPTEMTGKVPVAG